MFDDNNKFLESERALGNMSDFEPVTTIAATTALVSLGSSIFGGKKENVPAILDEIKALAISRDKAWASGNAEIAKAHNQLVQAVDAKYDNIKQEDPTLGGHRISNFLIVDQQNLFVGIPPRPGSPNPADWRSPSFSWYPFSNASLTAGNANTLNAPNAGNSTMPGSGVTGMVKKNIVPIVIGVVLLIFIVILLVMKK
jgi:hypothetical protein